MTTTPLPRPQVRETMVKFVIMDPSFVYTTRVIEEEGLLTNLKRYVGDALDGNNNEVLVSQDVLVVSDLRDITDEEAEAMGIDLVEYAQEILAERDEAMREDMKRRGEFA